MKDQPSRERPEPSVAALPILRSELTRHRDGTPIALVTVELEEFDVLGRLRSTPRHRLWAVVAGCAVVITGTACLLAGTSDGAKAAPPRLASEEPKPPETAWITVNRPFQTYDLSGGDFAKLPLSYSARRDSTGAARQDTLAYGAPGKSEPSFRVTLYRVGLEQVPDTSFFVDMARSASEAGLAVTRSGMPASLPTRFGAFETADVTLSGAGSSTKCLGFRLIRDMQAQTPLRVTGLACGSAALPMTRPALACTLDRLDLVSAGDDEALQTMFAVAERRRGPGCAPTRGTAGESHPVTRGDARL